MSNLSITADNHYILKLVYKDGDGFPIDLTGASAVFVLRRSMYSPVVIHKDAGINAEEGEIIFTILPEETADLLNDDIEETFIYGVQLTQVNGLKTNIAGGKAVIVQNVVRG